MSAMRAPMTWGDYHAYDALRASDLKDILKSPLHYSFWQQRKGGRKSTAALDLGQAIHSVILEPELFREQYVSYEGTRRGKVYDAFCAEHPGKTVLKDNDYRAVSDVVDSVGCHPIASTLLAGGDSEVSILWDCHGREAKARIDKLKPNLVLDVKSTTNVEPRLFIRDCIKYGYPLQMAFYADAVTALTGEHPEVKIVAVGKSAPYDVAVYDVPKSTLEFGRGQYMHALSLIEWGEATGHWPGKYEENEISLEVPEWALEDGDE